MRCRIWPVLNNTSPCGTYGCTLKVDISQRRLGLGVTLKTSTKKSQLASRWVRVMMVMAMLSLIQTDHWRAKMVMAVLRLIQTDHWLHHAEEDGEPPPQKEL